MDGLKVTTCTNLYKLQKIEFLSRKNILNKRTIYNGTHYGNNANYCSAY